MRASLWFAAALVALPSAQALTLEGSAGSPFQARGDVGVSEASWVLLVFSPQETGYVHLHATGVQSLVNHTTAWYKFEDPTNPVIGGSWDQDLIDQSVPWSGAFDANLTLGHGRWSSILLRGHGLGFNLTGETELQVPLAGDRPLSGSYNVVRDAYRPFYPATADLLLRAGGSHRLGHVPLLLHGEVDGVEWHNATVSCAVGYSCPDGANTPQFRVPGLFVQSLAYMEASTTGGQAVGGGEIFALAAGGPTFGMTLDGILRLPETKLSSCLPEPCPSLDGHTLTMKGHVGPSQWSAGADRRLSFAMQATPTAAFSDESPVPSMLRSAAPYVGGAVAVALLAKVLAALVAPVKKDPLEHGKRRALYDLILAEPGISYRQLLLQSGYGNGSVDHHLRVLAGAGLVVDQWQGKRRFLFENHGRYDKTWQAVAALRDEPARLLLEWIAANPGPTQGNVIAFSAAHGWSRTATQKRLNRLVAHGLVASNRQGRIVTYHARASSDPSTMKASVELAPAHVPGPASRIGRST